MSPIRNARIVLGVTGGIAAYKSVDLASKLVQAGATVHVILTDAGAEFVGAASFEAITQQPVHRSVFEPWRSDWHGHVSLGQLADMVVVAPATANSIAKLAHGLADDMLGTTILATTCPLLIAPAMEHQMFHHPATQENLDRLAARGARLVGPESGRLASGEMGDGRMSEPVKIMGTIRQVLGEAGPLRGRRIVVTAAGTRERIDPIRYVGNRSSGQMGYAVVQSLIDRGAEVTLVTGPASIPAPVGATVVPVESAVEMEAAVRAAVDGADALIMTAAVSDYRPETQFSHKLKKDDTGDRLTIDFVTNPDIVAGIEGDSLVKIGFAAETHDLLANARKKLAAKSLDMIVANDAESTIGSSASQATFLYPDREPEMLERMPKSEVADLLADRVVELLAKRSGES
ncbi:MAG: bifunctional phosphopantothenoylcysteine decarboxylase/phosphopantothenate--cysteine ligase CoaBC [Thermomicrobiales bacterium]|nr:bifunctional phosphopantothenoylcysteine decarboxylase/phosphopantothenate--cysteine ligase CoaBC [Thermomicrobiales bacterium]